MKTILAAVVALFLLLPAPAFSGYVIHLKDGTQFVTDQYFEEGDLVRFKRYGGLVGIEKDRISKIEEIEDPPEPSPKKSETDPETSEPNKKEAQIGQEAPAKGEPGPGTSKKEEMAGSAKELKKEKQVTDEQNKEPRKSEAEKIAAFLEKRRRLDREIKSVYSEFEEAKASKDKNGQKEHFDRLKSLRDKLTELEQEVRTAYNGNLPDWWKKYN